MTNRIKIYRSSIDGCRSVRQFSTLAGARKYAIAQVGSQDCFGGHYAVSDDGVVKITWAGVTREDLFRTSAPAIVLNKTHEFYRRGNDLFCRQAGLTRDHERQQIGRVVEVMDNITGDYHDGFRLRHNDGEARILFDEERKYATLEAACAAAKHAYLDFLVYLENDQ
jgi:hypothetical protein